MTFIASVVAKNGCAIIADSLVTKVHTIIEPNDFEILLKSKGLKSLDDDIKLDIKEIIGLFKTIPSYTRDYEEKLFKYDDYTAITTTGSATINNCLIYEIINRLIDKNKIDKSYHEKDTDIKVKEFCDYLKEEINNHFKTNDNLVATSFIYTNYDYKNSATTIYRINVVESSKENFNKKNIPLVTYCKAADYDKIVFDGQCEINMNILYGEGFTLTKLLIPLINKITEDFGIKKDCIPPDYIQKVNKEFLADIINNKKINIYKLTELSLQEAVNLANLLMRIEVDFQKYTKNIPTVGGVIKIAVIDKNRFRFISGNKVLPPKSY